MSPAAAHPPRTWQGVQAEVLRRIQCRTWPPGTLIPPEARLAAEFGCARATVNRALQALADDGLLDRRRRAGTRVALHPVRKAVLDIPVIRHEIEALDAAYAHRLTHDAIGDPPAPVAAQMRLRPGAARQVGTLHLADGAPYMVEERWINTATVPAASAADFAAISANEWLVLQAPYSKGDISFSADGATPAEAAALRIAPGAPLFTIERLTWHEARTVTLVRQAFAPGYVMRTGV